MFSCLSLSLLFVCSLAFVVQAEEPSGPVQAELHFKLWISPQPRGIQSTGSGQEKRVIHAGRFLINKGTLDLKVDYREGRKSKKVIYNGPQECRLFSAAKEGKDASILCSLSIPKSGKYLVLLQTSGPVDDPIFIPVLLPMEGKLKKGSMLYINQTDYRVRAVINSKSSITIPAQRSRQVKSRRGITSAIHLETQVMEGRSGRWKPIDSKVLSLVSTTRSVIIFYQAVGDSSIKTKLVTGL